MKSPAPILALVLGLSLAARADQADHRLDIYWNDVEGGGATLIVTPAGESILIDSGSPGTRDADRIRRTAAEIAGLRKIDFFILTHYHLDHFGGIAQLATLIPIGQVYDRGIPDHDPDHGTGSAEALWIRMSKPYREFRAEGRNRVVPGLLVPLTQAGGAPHLQLRCIASGQKFVDAPEGSPPNPIAGENSHHNLPPTDNDMSSSWVLDFGPFRFYDGGDLTWNMEGEIVTPVNRVGQVDVYQVDHHGLDLSNNPVLVHSLAPTVSVMNNGATKGTAKATVTTLKSSPGIQAMYQVHKNLRPADPEDNTADEFIANAAGDAKNCPANIIKLSVDPSGKSYTISIPATGHQRTYQTRLDKI